MSAIEKSSAHLRTRALHPLIVRTEIGLKPAKPDDYGRLRAYGEGCLDIAVARPSVKRALRIMNRVLGKLEKRGWKVSIDEERRSRKTMVRVDGENLIFRLVESSVRRDHVITSKEKEDLHRYPSTWLPRWDYFPSGVLALELDRGQVWGVQTSWKDGKKERLHGQVLSFIKGLEKAALSIKERRAEREKERLEWEERARKEEALRLRRLEEERRVQALNQEAVNWRQSRLIREFVGEVRRQALAAGDAPGAGGRLDAWLDWATTQADTLDPTKRLLAPLRSGSAASSGNQAGAADVTGEAKGAVPEPKASPEGDGNSSKGQTLEASVQERTFDRTVLYQQVWSRPVQLVAKDYRMSGRGLAKACRRLLVPVPPRGYWARVRNGHKESKPALPSLGPRRLEGLTPERH